MGVQLSDDRTIRLGAEPAPDVSSGGVHAERRPLRPVAPVPVVPNVNAQLADAEANNRTLELVVVLRGTVHRRRGDPPWVWHLRLPDGHYRVISAESVIAATPAKDQRTVHEAARRFMRGR